MMLRAVQQGVCIVGQSNDLQIAFALACGNVAGARVKAKGNGKLIGYARVSTDDQELRMQRDALEKAGCWNIYEEKRSATRGKRPELELALLDLRPGDTLVVWKLDRLVRNARGLYELLDRIHAAGANFKSLQEQFDFTTPMGQFVLGILGLVAQLEAQMTAHRTAAGIAALKASGGTYGAKPKLSAAKAARLVAERKAGVTVARLAAKYGVSTASVNNYMKRAKLRRKRT
jgi:DNA invertase Pin-like site-specific DNA recombinase